MNAPRFGHALPMKRLASLLLLTLLLRADSAAAPGPPRPGGKPAAPVDSMPSIKTRDFELVAPSDDDIRSANDEIRVAISQFGRYMGENPRKMAFVLFRSAADAGRYDTRGFTRRNLPVVALVIGPKPRRPGPAPPQPGDANADPLSHLAGHQFLIEYANHAIAAARAAGLTIPDSAALAPGGPAGARGAPAAANDRHPGHPALPDWLEEAVAGLCERPSFQRARIEFLGARLDRRIPFEELLRMSRPAAGDPGRVPSERAAIFSAEALSLARFIAQREEDDRFVGTIIEGVLRGRTVGDVLNTSQNLYSKPDALEKQWLEWVQDAARPR